MGDLAPSACASLRFPEQGGIVSDVARDALRGAPAARFAAYLRSSYLRFQSLDFIKRKTSEHRI